MSMAQKKKKFRKFYYYFLSSSSLNCTIGYGQDISMHFTAYLPRMEHELAVTSKSESQPPVNSNNNNTISTHPNQSVSVIPASEFCQQQEQQTQKSLTMPIVTIQHPLQRKSLSMCFTSTGATLSLPPKKKDIYRPYSLDDKPTQRPYGLRIPAEEDLHAAHAILGLSILIHTFICVEWAPFALFLLFFYHSLAITLFIHFHT